MTKRLLLVSLLVLLATQPATALDRNWLLGEWKGSNDYCFRFFENHLEVVRCGGSNTHIDSAVTYEVHSDYVDVKYPDFPDRLTEVSRTDEKHATLHDDNYGTVELTLVYNW